MRKKLFLFGVILLISVITLVGYCIYLVPDMGGLERIGKDRPAVVYSIEGIELARYVAQEDRPFLAAKYLPKSLEMAVVVSEDPNFYQHQGFELLPALKRLFLLRLPKTTISLRLARFYLRDYYNNELPWIVKLVEIPTTILIEKTFTKKEIIALYLYYANFGGNIDGIEAAAREYFNKTAVQLSASENATLIGMLVAPNRYHPIKHPIQARRRRNTILFELYKKKVLSKDAYDVFCSNPLKTQRATKKVTIKEGIAPHFVAYLREYLKEWCKKNKKDLYADGLKIYTTIHFKLQNYAKDAVYQHLRKHQQRLDTWVYGNEPWRKDSTILLRALRLSDRYRVLKTQGESEEQIHKNFRTKTQMRVFNWYKPEYYTDTILSPWDSLKYYSRFLEPGLITIDQRTGYILAWVGGLKHEFFQYDHVMKAKRQVGSTFKPFVYGAAFEKGYKPCDRLLNHPLTITAPDGAKWTPQNADYDYCGEVSLRYGIVHSLNVVAARLIQQIKPETVVDFARKMGIQSELKPIPALALGVFDLSVAELTSGYAPFFAGGKRSAPTFVLRIEDAAGNTLEDFSPVAEQVISPTDAHTMVEMLRGVTTNGTAGNVRWESGLPWDLDIGGKTGTTQNNSDGWFIGATPYFTTGVWVGCSDRRMGFGRFSELGRGSHMAMPIWANYMEKVYKDAELKYQSRRRFIAPRNYNVSTYCYGDPIRLPKGDSTQIDTANTKKLNQSVENVNEENSKSEFVE